MKQNYGYIRIDGSTSSVERQNLVARFQRENNDIRVGLLSVTAAGQGITLTKASVVVFAELHWTPGYFFFCSLLFFFLHF
jgi:SWI/SNF-related matrix-associated actin-dependent regulator 1 of chromatin subfamily A